MNQPRRVKLYSETGKWPDTDEGWCEYFKELDRRYNAGDVQRPRATKSPLHHDNRCPIHGPKGEKR